MSTLSFTTFTQKGMITYITWKFGVDIYKKQELYAECTNGSSVNDLNFQFKIVSLKEREDYSNSCTSKLYFRCRYEVHIISIKYLQTDRYGDTKTCDQYDDRIIKPYMWMYLTTIERSNKSMIKLQITTIVSEKIDPPFLLESRSSDFKNLLCCGSFSDAIMKSADGDEYKVHKAFLTCRSPVLKAHFVHNTTESVTNIVESPLESEVLNEVINFIYTDQAPNVAMMPEKLLAAANFYQLDRLKGLSEEALYIKLTADNALETLQLAELYCCENLKKSTLQFIKEKAQLITKTEAWAEMNSLESLQLIKNIFEHVTKENN